MEDLLKICTPLIQAVEGLRLFQYKDTQCHTTIGYGHNLDAKGISKNVANLMLQEDLEEAISGCQRDISFFDSLDMPRQYVLVNMAFNLGIGGLCSFQKMLAALQIGNYQEAAQEIANSLEAKQVPSRMFPLIKIMESGVFPNNDDAAKTG